MTDFASEIVGLTRGWLGTPYRHQASLRGAGCDCLGLIRGVWRDLYGDEVETPPPYSADWRDMHHDNALMEAAERHLNKADEGFSAGQVVLFRLQRNRPSRHCGIVTDANHFVHAQEGEGVVEIALTDAWRRRVAGIYNFPDNRSR